MPFSTSTVNALYRGRFAPTPSGHLHLGSLLTALASWLQARRHNGGWLLRIDDLDTARCPPGMDSIILRQLEAHGLYWDETPRYQSQHSERYRTALQVLAQVATLYACNCTRKALKQRLRPGPDDLVYDGHCRERRLPHAGHALRLQLEAGELCLPDRWHGEQHRELQTDVGDFVVARLDGTPGYQLASVIDDHDMRITEVVRGADLIGSSIRQRHLFDVLQLPAPAFRHLPLLIATDGRKLSKQNHAPAVASGRAARNLWQCLEYLGQSPPASLGMASVATVLQWAQAHWQETAIPRRTTTTLVGPA